MTAWVNEAVRSRNLFLFTLSLRPKPFSPEVHVAKVSSLWDGGAADVNDGALLPTCGHGRGERQVARGFWLPPE